jgi:hypothetical protein
MKQFFSLLILLQFTVAVWAQAPQAINYQGVARNASGVAYAGQQINVRLSIRTGIPDGTVEYSETRSVTTNQFGLFNVQIGSTGASVIQGNFTAINWSAGSKFLQTEISVNGQPYTNLGTTQMMSVPFSLHSNESKDLIFPFSKSIGTSGNMFSLTNDNTSNSSNTIKSTAVGGRAFHGSATTGVGGFFLSNSGTGMYGESNSGTAIWGESPNGNGIIGISNNVNGIGVTAVNNANGIALAVDGNVRINGGNTNPGVGKVLTSDASGNATWQTAIAGGSSFKLPLDTTVNINNSNVFRIKNTTTASYNTITGESFNGYGMLGSSENSTGVFGSTKGKNQSAVGATAFADSAVGVRGYVHFNFKDGVGVFGDGAINNNGVRGKSTNKAGVQGFSEKNYGVYGESKDFDAVAGISTNQAGVSGTSVKGVGVIGYTMEGTGAVYGGAGFWSGAKQFGVMGEATANSIGVIAKNNTTTSLALSVEGKMKISGYGQNPGVGKVLTSDASGNATWEHPQSFAFRSSSIVNNGNQNVPFATWSEVKFHQTPKYNVGDGYNGNTSKFVAPEKGIYHFDVQIEWVENTRWTGVRIMRNSGGIITAIANDFTDEQGTYVNYGYLVFNRASTDFLLEKGDIIYIEAYTHSDNKIKGADSRTFFNGHLIMRF